LGFGYNNSGSSFGRKSGFLAGAIGSSVADIAMGYQHFAPVTFVVKGFEDLWQDWLCMFCPKDLKKNIM